MHLQQVRVFSSLSSFNYAHPAEKRYEGQHSFLSQLYGDCDETVCCTPYPFSDGFAWKVMNDGSLFFLTDSQCKLFSATPIIPFIFPLWTAPSVWPTSGSAATMLILRASDTIAYWSPLWTQKKCFQCLAGAVFCSYKYLAYSVMCSFMADSGMSPMVFCGLCTYIGHYCLCAYIGHHVCVWRIPCSWNARILQLSEVRNSDRLSSIPHAQMQDYPI